MREAVYILCALTSLACAVLLVRSYFRSRTKLLLWSSVCFVGLTINNVLLVIDRLGDLDLSLSRSLTAFAAVLSLLLGLVWSTRSS
jgi:hypothetical protein